VVRATRIVDRVAAALDSAHEWQASVSHIRPQLPLPLDSSAVRVVVSLLLGCDASIGREWVQKAASAPSAGAAVSPSTMSGQRGSERECALVR